jgi:hypothetical protein
MFALPRSKALICKRKDAGLPEKKMKIGDGISEFLNVTISTPPNSKKNS